MELAGRTVLVTGGSAGIGLGLAKRMLALGNTVIITGRNLAKLEAAKAAQPKLHILVADAADPAALTALAARIDADFPALDLLINNAGIMRLRNVTHGTDDLLELTQEIDINVSGPIRTVSVLVDRLRANRGAIVNVSSGLAWVPIQAAPIYCATKAAIHSYTVALRQQLEGQVEVIELMPPGTKTELMDEFEGADFQVLPLDTMLDATIAGLKAGHTEIRPGQSNQLYWMNRIAPGFIQGQLAKGSKSLVPSG
jgi:uncharacterized oxidoreductase